MGWEALALDEKVSTALVYFEGLTYVSTRSHFKGKLGGGEREGN